MSGTGTTTRVAEALGWAGCIQARINRQTGTLVAVIDSHAPGGDWMDAEAGRYTLLCDDHSETIAVETKAQVSTFAPVPDEWCEQCMGVAS